MERALIRKLKLPDARGDMGAYLLGADDHGTWFFTPARSPIAWTNIDKSGQWEHDVLFLVPRDDWYFALWWADHPTVEIGVDVTAPTLQEGNVWSWVDLEIDLHRFRDGRVEIEDEDEFEESCANGWITDDQREAALRITPILERMLRERTEPFGDVGRRRLDDAAALGLAPLEPPLR